jgi:putative membrane protein
MGGIMEARMGQMGLDYGASSGVKRLAQLLLDDHTKSNNELTEIANRKGLTLGSEDREMPNGLPGLNGDAFDKEFKRLTVKDHERDIKEFEKEASSGLDPDLKAWASKMLPILHAHLDAAKALK